LSLFHDEFSQSYWSRTFRQTINRSGFTSLTSFGYFLQYCDWQNLNRDINLFSW
jgi:hypothetical protein